MKPKEVYNFYRLSSSLVGDRLRDCRRLWSVDAASLLLWYWSLIDNLPPSCPRRQSLYRLLLVFIVLWPDAVAASRFALVETLYPAPINGSYSSSSSFCSALAVPVSASCGVFIGFSTPSEINTMYHLLTKIRDDMLNIYLTQCCVAASGSATVAMISRPLPTCSAPRTMSYSIASNQILITFCIPVSVYTCQVTLTFPTNSVPVLIAWH